MTHSQVAAAAAACLLSLADSSQPVCSLHRLVLGEEASVEGEWWRCELTGWGASGDSLRVAVEGREEAVEVLLRGRYCPQEAL